MIEHSGGTPALAFETSGREERSIAVAITLFDYDLLDSDEERLQEAALLDLDMRPLLAAIVARETSLAAQEAASAIIILVLDARDPQIQAEQIAWAVGMYALQGVSMPQLAKRHRLSKQAFQQAIRRLREKLQLRQTRASRSDAARSAMRLAYRGTRLHKGAHRLFNYNPSRSITDLIRWFRQEDRAMPVARWTSSRRRALEIELAPIALIHASLLLRVAPPPL